MLTYNVDIWSIRKRSGRAKPYELRWRVGSRPHSKSFKLKPQADGRRSELLTALREREQFDEDTGLPDGDEVAFIADRVASGRAYKRNEQTQTVSRVQASDLVAEGLGVAVDSEVYARARLVKEGTQPTHTLTSYYRPEHVEGTRIVDPTPGPAGRGGGYRVLYDAGYEIDHMKEALFARVPTADEMQLLQLPVGEPVMELHRTTYTADGTVVEFAVGIHAASRFAWEYEFEVPDSAKDDSKDAKGSV